MCPHSPDHLGTVPGLHVHQDTLGEHIRRQVVPQPRCTHRLIQARQVLEVNREDAVPRTDQRPGSGVDVDAAGFGGESGGRASGRGGGVPAILGAAS